MQLLITGATGFIGSNLATTLDNRGYKVKALVRSIEKASDLLGSSNISFFEGDITQADTLEECIAPGDIIIHVAALYNDPTASFEKCWQTNVIGTENLIKASIAKSVKRFIFCSSIVVAMNSGNPPYDENSPYSPSPEDFYEVTKCEAEKLVLRYFQKQQFPAVVLRPVQVFGPGDMKNIKFYKMVRMGITFGNGRVTKRLIYIDDLVNAFELAIHKEGIEGEVFILKGEPAVNLNDMVKWAAEQLKVSYPRIKIPVAPIKLLSTAVEKACKPLKLRPPLYRSRVGFFTKSHFFHTDKAEKVLGFSPRVQIRQGLTETVEWYKKEKFL